MLRDEFQLSKPEVMRLGSAASTQVLSQMESIPQTLPSFDDDEEDELYHKPK